MKNHTGWDTDLSQRFYGKPNDLVKHLRGRSENRTELDCVAADEIERLTAGLESEVEAHKMTLNREELLTAEVSHKDKALRFAAGYISSRSICDQTTNETYTWLLESVSGKQPPACKHGAYIDCCPVCADGRESP